MNTARNLSLLALAIAAASPAFATKCPDGLDYSQHPEGRCDWYYQGTDPTRPTSAGSTSAATAGANAGAAAGSVAGVKSSNDTRVVVNASGAPISNEQRQQQAQQQQQASTATGGSATGTGTVSVAGSSLTGGSTVTNNRTEVNSLYLPSFAPAPALPPMIASNSQAVLSACMPRKEIWREKVFVLVRNSFGPDEMQHVGWDEFTRDSDVPYKIIDVPVAFNADGTIVYQKVPHGHQQLTKKEFQKAAAGSSFNIAGIGKNGGGGVGGGDQGVVERWSTSIELFDCPLELKPAVLTRPPVFVEVPAKKGRR